MPEGSPASELAKRFVHLHNHSHYSLLDGLQKVPEMLDRTSALGMKALALTDHGTLSGAIEFYTGAKARGIKPIIGMEAYVAPRRLADKSGKLDANPYHLILLASSLKGYQNLMRLTSIAHLDGFYYKPRVDRELLAQYHEGLIVLSGCAGGEVAMHLRNGNMAGAEEAARWYATTFGEGNYYLELQDHEHQWAEQKRLNDELRKLAAQTGLPMVVTADSHYALPSDREAHEILLCVQTGKTIGDSDRMTMEMELSLTDPAELAGRWSGEPELITNTAAIAERCDLELELGGIHLPRFQVPTAQTEREYLEQLTFQGLAWRYGGIPKEDITHYTPAKARGVVAKEVVERLEFELGVIEKMGYESYFLVVADFINWGKNQGIIFGPGRGSAAGSIVAYALNITDLDPLKYDLLFERFLNPDRISMPDIDIDMQDTRRGEVIDYVVGKYGTERVAQIITFGTMAARNAVRDTGRALGMSYAEVDVIAKLVPPPVQGRHIPLAVSTGLARPQAADQRPDQVLVREYQTNPNAKRLIDTAIRLEGTIRSNGVHAAGVVIAPDDIVKFVPLQRAQKGGIVTQYEMHTIEDQIGLLKMDFLGLSNLTIINNTLRIVRKVYGTTLATAEIPLDNPETFAMLSRGDTTGVFQLESAGMKRYLRELEPTSFDDIIAMVALYRPGPMQWIDDFISRKHGRSQTEYIHPVMEDALKSTYGILVYQEQVMQISKDMCGYSGGQADTLRKSIGKKKPAEMAKLRQSFIEGAIKTVGADRALIESFWTSLEAFAAYCFPKAHAACYALIAYQTAYLKAHYPAAFMAALMTSDYGNIDRIAIEVAECRRMGIPVLAPDVNQSFGEFGVVPELQSIRFGLNAIKNVGVGAIETILKAREDGTFTSVEDFGRRVSASEVNKKVWESLIKSGAFDTLGDRAELLFNIDSLTGYAAKAQKNALSGQIDIFGSLGLEQSLPPLHLEPVAEATSLREQLGWERELLGLYLSRHPLDDFEGFLQKKTRAISDISTKLEGKPVVIGGIVTTVRRITTRNNDAMAFVGLADKTGELELVVFPKIYEGSVEFWEPDQLIKVSGKVSAKDREGKLTSEIKIIVDKVRALTDEDAAVAYDPAATESDEDATAVSQPDPVPAPLAAGPAAPVAVAADPRALVITLADAADTARLVQLKQILADCPGSQSVYVVVGAGEVAKKIRLPFGVGQRPELLDQLAAIVGAGRVAWQEA